MYDNIIQGINETESDVKIHDEFAGESVSFVNFIEAECDKQIFNTEGQSNLFKEDDLSFFGCLMPSLLRDGHIYSEYVSDKEQYDHENFANYNYWKQGTMFCDRYNHETDLKKKNINDQGRKIPDTNEIKIFFSRNYRSIISCLAIFGVAYFLTMLKTKIK